MLHELIAVDSPAVVDIDLKWYVVIAQPQKTKMALFYLDRFGFKTACPFVPKKRSRTIRTMFGQHTTYYDTSEPFLPGGYIPIQLNFAWSFGPLYELPGLRYGNPFLKSGGVHLTLSEAAILEIEKDAAYARITKPLEIPYQVGDFVEIIEGPFEGMKGFISRLDNKKRIVVSFLSASSYAVVSVRQIKAAPTTT